MARCLLHAPAPASAAREVHLGRRLDARPGPSAERARAPVGRRHATGDARSWPGAGRRPGFHRAADDGNAGSAGAVGRHALGRADGQPVSGQPDAIDRGTAWRGGDGSQRAADRP